ncbi:hypothetical protein AS200_28055 [Streptomyces sp. CdTB01]|nr:hypothetical protein AS200_28055 [Streptomyces sp. CdTB01]
MDAYYDYDLDSDRGRNVLVLDIKMGHVEMKVAADIIKGHPCADEFTDIFPDMAQYLQEPPDGTHR